MWNMKFKVLSDSPFGMVRKNILEKKSWIKSAGCLSLFLSSATANAEAVTWFPVALVPATSRCFPAVTSQDVKCLSNQSLTSTDRKPIPLMVVGRWVLVWGGDPQWPSKWDQVLYTMIQFSLIAMYMWFQNSYASLFTWRYIAGYT